MFNAGFNYSLMISLVKRKKLLLDRVRMYERETFSDSDLTSVLKESGTVLSHDAFFFL